MNHFIQIVLPVRFLRLFEGPTHTQQSSVKLLSWVSLGMIQSRPLMFYPTLALQFLEQLIFQFSFLVMLNFGRKAK